MTFHFSYSSLVLLQKLFKQNRLTLVLRRAKTCVHYIVMCTLPILGERYPTNAQWCCKQYFIVLIRLPRHVLAYKCHLQGVTLSFHKPLQFLVCVSGRCGLLFSRCDRLLWNASQYVLGRIPINFLCLFAKQAKEIYRYKNIKQKLHKTIATIRYNLLALEFGI
jgi:hypothetical protein